MHNSALQGEQPALLFSDCDPSAMCVFCNRPRPLELLTTWMCSRCKRKSLFELIWKRKEANE
jgi:hypothetical protein